ncbi:MAG TPA: hypothetical protein VL547_22400 [Dinghuibacter sp.]|jgi:hypothetical protein|uniref:hypothetical protein n=1 Tax=Dinghuibacter sp. TaxID=2024697 RepID=UPI002B86102D|nr:hypothetical protein [Dinghuibacter sp.]HTJ14813.1 hypothetical protein [Dinghuibacter sp.]
MKKILAIAAIALTAATAKADTKSINGAKVNNKAEAHFTENYKGASGLWNVDDNYVEVLFFWKDTLMDSFYDKDGNLIGTFHDISADQLTERAKSKIASWYKGYHIVSASLMQRDDDDDVTYVKIASDNHIRILQVEQSGVITEYQTIR